MKKALILTICMAVLAGCAHDSEVPREDHGLYPAMHAVTDTVGTKITHSATAGFTFLLFTLLVMAVKSVPSIQRMFAHSKDDVHRVNYHAIESVLPLPRRAKRPGKLKRALARLIGAEYDEAKLAAAERVTPATVPPHITEYAGKLALGNGIMTGLFWLGYLIALGFGWAWG